MDNTNYTANTQWAKSPKKQCIFDNMALYFEYQIDENALLQTIFWRFCPLGQVEPQLYTGMYS